MIVQLTDTWGHKWQIETRPVPGGKYWMLTLTRQKFSRGRQFTYDLTLNDQDRKALLAGLEGSASGYEEPQ